MALAHKQTPTQCAAGARHAPFSVHRQAVRPARRVTVSAAEAEAAAPGVELVKSMSYMKPVLDIEAIKGVLPHRHVALLAWIT